MRATDLNFRSPKLKSGEYTLPQCDYKGGKVIGPTKFSKNAIVAMSPIREKNTSDEMFRTNKNIFYPGKN